MTGLSGKSGLSLAATLIAVICSLSAALSGTSGSAALAAEDFTIRPGVGIGAARIGMTRADVKARLGNIDGSYDLPDGVKVDYAEWHNGEDSTTISYYYDIDGKIEQVSSNAPIPVTADGISVKSTLSAISAKYKNLQEFQPKTPREKGYCLDDRSLGIAFIFKNEAGPSDHPLIVIVHKAGRAVIGGK